MEEGVIMLLIKLSGGSCLVRWSELCLTPIRSATCLVRINGTGSSPRSSMRCKMIGPTIPIVVRLFLVDGSLPLSFTVAVELE